MDSFREQTFYPIVSVECQDVKKAPPEVCHDVWFHRIISFYFGFDFERHAPHIDLTINKYYFDFFEPSSSICS